MAPVSIDQTLCSSLPQLTGNDSLSLWFGCSLARAACCTSCTGLMQIKSAKLCCRRGDSVPHEGELHGRTWKHHRSAGQERRLFSSSSCWAAGANSLQSSESASLELLVIICNYQLCRVRSVILSFPRKSFSCSVSGEASCP